MRIDSLSATGPAPQGQPRPSNIEEAAQQFEEVLVKELVKTMTAGLFDQGLAGENTPSWMSGQQDMQRDSLADVLTRHLVDQGNLGIADRLVAQWEQANGAAPE